MARATALSRCHNIADLRAAARRRLPGPIFDYLDGAAEDETTARRNTFAFDDVSLVPSALVDTTSVRTRTTVLGLEIGWPVICSPAGMARMYDGQGELAVARAAARADTMYGLSIAASRSLEEVAAASDGPKLFQLYIFRDRGLTLELIDRCKAAGYSALCLTVDSAVRGNRERELRTGLGIPLKLSLGGVASFARHPRWVLDTARSGPLSMPNFRERTGSDDIVAHTRYIDQQLDASVTWADVGAMIAHWGGPFAIKGVLSADDARRSADVGAAGVIVSNHGGRQLEGAAAAVQMLPDIADAVGDRLDVILESGVRRGSHVLKALALGAKACAIGRPYLFGLAAGGEAGVDRALTILRAELTRAMQLSGCIDVTAVPRELVRRFA